jgi:hypothetical protein
MRERDVKLLWGRAGGICAVCKGRLSQESTPGPVPIGEAAHIVAESPDGPRGGSQLTVEERDGYTNRILLCPTDHTIIDRSPTDFPIERLHIIKRDHELWVEQQLSVADERNRVAQEVYASLVDAAAEACDFENWHEWASRVVSTLPRWRADAASVAFAFRQRIIGAAWPGTSQELERALQTLSICMNKAAQRFVDETEERDDERIQVKYYQSERGQENRDYLFNRWDKWVAHMDLLIVQPTKAANWLAEVVRRDLNPAFLAVSGKFILTVPDDLRFATFAPEFSPEEKARLPAGLDLTQPDDADEAEEDD